MIIDHYNNKFVSLSKMVEYWCCGKNYSIESNYLRHIEQGYSIEEALYIIPHFTQYTINKSVFFKSYINDKIYLDIAININNNYIYKCKINGEDILLTDNIIVNICRNYNENKVKEYWKNHYFDGFCQNFIDHKGNKFDSLDDMLIFWNISKNHYRWGKSAGYTLIEILEGRFIDHEGNRFHTINERNKYWNITKDEWNRWNQSGLSFDDMIKKKMFKFIDHKGNKFDTLKDMLLFWNTSDSAYHDRKLRGLSLEECLTGEFIYKDILNNRFRNLSDMCNYWQISVSNYKQRKSKYNLPIEYCLGIVPIIKVHNPHLINTFLTDNLFLEKVIEKNKQLYCQCKLNDESIILSKSVIEDICRKYNIERINKLHENDDINYRAG